MPLYEYECDACAHRFEVIQKFSDAPIESARSAAAPCSKLLSSPAIQFKGSGWYLTDYGRGGQDRRQATCRRARTSRAAPVTASARRRGDSRSTKAAACPNRTSTSREAAPSGFAGEIRSERVADTRGTARPDPAASARSRRPPSGTPACCRCRGGRRRPRRRRAGRVCSRRRKPLVSWISPDRSLAVASSAGKMSGVRM